MEKPIKYVLAGGPGIGKTTQLEYLRELGYNIGEEVARKIIAEQQAINGKLLPTENLQAFQYEVLSRQLEQEAALPEGQISFLDRSLIDCIGYCYYGNIEPPRELVLAVQIQRYDKVFLLEPLQHYNNDGQRKENEEEARKIHECIKKAYLDYGYEPIMVPDIGKKERLEFILNHVEQEVLVKA